MKRKFLVECLFIVFGILVLSQAAVAQGKSKKDTLDVLAKKLSEQKSQIELQQKRIQELESMVEQLNKKKPFAVFPSDPKKSGRPNNAFPFEFNGNTYYFVPLIGKNITDIETLEKTKRDSK